MEELVGAVMTDFSPASKCRYCGKSGDGGVDLMLVIGDKPCAIQVKHRQRIDQAESVHYVTHFIGALMLKNIPNGIFVTTAERFSTAAKAAGKTILSRGLVERFELIARQPFLEMLEATSKPLSDPWRRCIPKVLLHDHERLTPYSVGLIPPTSGS
ncbi:MAG: restriction endonuclease [Candidatus Hydrogenedentes bacterium]|nr:restriction endonuclease [Candidatus Hydrogenedentota bacterium]